MVEGGRRKADLCYIYRKTCVDVSGVLFLFSCNLGYCCGGCLFVKKKSVSVVCMFLGLAVEVRRGEEC